MLRRLLTAVLSAGLLLTALAPPSFAVEPIPGRALPDEGTTVVLTERATTALPFDLDGDGVRELLVVTATAERAGFAAVQAFWVDGNGRATASNLVNLRRSATFDDRIAIGNGIRIDDEGMTAVRISEPARLFTARRNGEPVALLAAIGSNPELTVPCCVTVWEVRPAGAEGIELALVAETYEFGSQIAAADLDGDGTDEMVVIESTPRDEGTSLQVGILRWDGSRYVRSRTLVPDARGCCATILDLGETDGASGEDVLLNGTVPGSGGGLMRLTLREGSPTVEVARFEDMFGFPVEEVSGARVLPVVSGPTILIVDPSGSTLQWSWGRDKAIELRAVLSPFGVPLAIIGAGAATRILLGQWPSPQSVTVVTGDVSETSNSVLFGQDTRAAVFGTVAHAVGIPADVFAGPVPGGLHGGTDAYMFGGQVITAPSDPAAPPERTYVATLPGLAPAGTVGPSAGWMALFPAAAQSPEFFPSGAAPSPRVVDLAAGGLPGPISLVETAEILQPEQDHGLLTPTFHGVAPDPNRSLTLIVGREAVDAEIAGPVGTTIWWTTSAQSVTGPGVGQIGSPNQATIGPGRVAKFRLLESADPEVPDGSAAFVHMWLVTPAGHAYRGIWLIRIYRQPPDLGMEEAMPLVDFVPTVSGQTLPGSTIAVNGVHGEVGPDGSFTVPVDVGVLPTELRIVATDLVGNRTERVVTRVWPLDYRQLPFVPIAVLVTVVAAAVLFLRQPESRPGRRLTPEDESTFEEIGG